MRFLAISLIFALSCSLCLALSVRQNPEQPTDSDNDTMKKQCTKNFEIISHDSDYQRLYACIGNQIVPLRCRHCLRMEPSQSSNLFDSIFTSLKAKEQGCLVVCGDNTNGENQVGEGTVGAGSLSGLGGLSGQLGNAGQAMGLEGNGSVKDMSISPDNIQGNDNYISDNMGRYL
ncbi:uncharacterized protein LOC112904068 [Agrilus planipennis]|uniref:Uncharacterized protein LOC108734960 n=1 Tax=Agrilus planipennis TaxID=224129 RepID=A0A1W4WQD0_AGRPL|nr:uncharacterized protein LOC108734960 [Agrilus planipennis]XP_025829057.1 uncharacterized protein LOC112904068 [Agrilus planipennis]